MLKILKIIGTPLICLMILYPNILQIPKAILLFLLIASFLLFKKTSLKFNKSQLLWILIYTASNFFSIFYGIILDNPAPDRYVLVYLLWPVLFFFIFQNISKRILPQIVQVFLYCLLVINVSGIIAFVLFNFVGINSFIFFTPLIKPGFPLLAIASPVVTSFIFLYFFNLSILFISKQPSRLIIVNSVLGIIFMILTSRRVLYINLVLSVLLIYVFCKLGKVYINQARKNLIRFAVFILLFLSTIFYFSINYINYSFADFTNLIVGAFGAENANDPRTMQSEALYDGWKKSPILGNGTGVDTSISRSEIPGTYELSYNAMLFERGIIGCLVYLLLYAILNYWCLRAIKYSFVDNKYVIAYLVALTSFMIANATNPYLNAFDYLWILFFGFIFINNTNSLGIYKEYYSSACR